jgi:uncharacterized protein (DUF305 family)
MTRTSAILSLVVLGAAGCTPPAPSDRGTSHHTSSDPGRMEMANTGDPDSDFLRAMIPHHQGAIDMARQELAAGTDPKVRQLAKEVIAAQQAEISQMEAWLEERQKASAERKK